MTEDAVPRILHGYDGTIVIISEPVQKLEVVAKILGVAVEIHYDVFSGVISVRIAVFKINARNLIGMLLA